MNTNSKISQDDLDYLKAQGFKEVQIESSYTNYDASFKKALWKKPNSAPQRGSLEFTADHFPETEKAEAAWKVELEYDGQILAIEYHKSLRLAYSVVKTDGLGLLHKLTAALES